MAAKSVCSIDGCGKPHSARGWCRMHYMRWLTHGSPHSNPFKPRGTCSAKGCDRRHFRHGYCAAHSSRWIKYGDPFGGKAERGSLRRFVDEVAVNFNGEDCLLWPYSTVKGYGSLSVGGKKHYAHRLVCEQVKGPPPSTKHEVAHSCGNCLCVNPSHLRWATHAENEADKIVHGTTIRGERAGPSKLTLKDVLEIRSLEGVKPEAEIAALYGVARVTINRIHRRQRWASF